MSITEFLLARIAEDEARFQRATITSGTEGDAAIFARRILADCDAKRRLVEDEHFDGRSGDHVDPWCATCSDDENLVYLPCPTLRLLALPYSDHPDHRDEWRP